jgi:hypothetical protein
MRSKCGDWCLDTALCFAATIPTQSGPYWAKLAIGPDEERTC